MFNYTVKWSQIGYDEMRISDPMTKKDAVEYFAKSVAYAVKNGGQVALLNRNEEIIYVAY
jgi:hypothetical protein